MWAAASQAKAAAGRRRCSRSRSARAGGANIRVRAGLARHWQDTRADRCMSTRHGGRSHGVGRSRRAGSSSQVSKVHVGSERGRAVGARKTAGARWGGRGDRRGRARAHPIEATRMHGHAGQASGTESHTKHTCEHRAPHTTRVRGRASGTRDRTTVARGRGRDQTSTRQSGSTQVTACSVTCMHARKPRSLECSQATGSDEGQRAHVACGASCGASAHTGEKGEGYCA